MPAESKTDLKNELFQISEKCKSCKLCSKQCGFLKKYGTPKDIADQFSLSQKEDSLKAFECNLCNLCTAVCPVDIDPANMFLEMRRHAVNNGWGELPNHKKLLSFEKIGSSKLFSFHALPKGCDTVLFPGCALSASRASIVKDLYRHLTKEYSNLGLVLDCCTKPSHDLGRADYFKNNFSKVTDFLIKSGVKKVLVACPSCHNIFTEYTPLEVNSVYEKINVDNLPGKDFANLSAVTFHDSCTARFEDNILSSVRNLAKNIGLEVQEMKHHGRKALCCGEGGGACFMAPTLIDKWKTKRNEEIKDRLVLTYCAGCTNFIGNEKAKHILDLLFSKEIAKGKKPKIAKAPFTYWHRLRLKKWAKKNVATTAKETI